MNLMDKTVVNAESERFRSGVEKYAAYLKTSEGRLRLDLTFANLQEFLPPAKQPFRILDLGCGTGEMSVRLARLGHHVTLLDSSLPMLEYAKQAAQESGTAERIVLKNGDATDLASVFPAESFDAVLCHNILEYVADPSAVLRSAAGALRDASSIISILVRNQSGEVLKAAIKEGDLEAAERNLSSQWANESLYGGRVGVFTEETLTTMLSAEALTVTAERGVRVVSDYLPPRVSRDDEYDRIFELEYKLGKRVEFAEVARYTHCLAHRRDVAKEDV